jgi:prolyl-tRNA synthetase
MHGTVKNAIETRRNIYTEYESDNLRKYLLSAGYILVISTGYYSNLPFCFNLLKNAREID